ncbi:ATP-binding protein, partial [Bradyrhizobium manausense]|uniref:ATP-binding protein n=1 Tax=Bradyrhizobium manausense TaxID=989370 RepID=UPI00196BA458
MLWTNLRNQVRQTPLPKWKPLIPLFEAVMNSFQAIRDAKRPSKDGFIKITVERDAVLLDEEFAPVQAFTITDNGIGLNDENFDSFNTAFSDHKLTRGGKGLGRFTWLKAFDKVDIDSTFKEKGEDAQRRTFTFDEDYEMDTEGLPKPSPGRGTGSTIGL